MEVIRRAALVTAGPSRGFAAAVDLASGTETERGRKNAKRPAYDADPEHVQINDHRLVDRADAKHANERLDHKGMDEHRREPIFVSTVSVPPIPDAAASGLPARHVVPFDDRADRGWLDASEWPVNGSRDPVTGNASGRPANWTGRDSRSVTS